jgi:hypothetical protein
MSILRKIEWGISERDLLRCEKTRKVGKLRFIIVQGLLFRGSVLFAVAMLFELFIWRQQLSLRLIETNAFVWFLGALVLTLWAWDRNESTYRATHITSRQAGPIELRDETQRGITNGIEH